MKLVDIITMLDNFLQSFPFLLEILLNKLIQIINHIIKVNYLLFKVFESFLYIDILEGNLFDFLFDGFNLLLSLFEIFLNSLIFTINVIIFFLDLFQLNPAFISRLLDFFQFFHNFGFLIFYLFNLWSKFFFFLSVIIACGLNGIIKLLLRDQKLINI